MNFYFYGAGKTCQRALQRLKFYDSELLGICDSFCEKTKDGKTIEKIEMIDKSATVVITVANNKMMYEIWEKLLIQGFTSIYWYLDRALSGVHGNSFEEYECLDLSAYNLDDALLNHIEIHVSDTCNLNCRNCAHYSPLFTEPNWSIQNKLRDLRIVRDKLDYIGRINLLGGEPLLNPNLKDFLCKLRPEFPNSVLRIYTNGLLIPSLSDELFSVIRDNQVEVIVSEYKPTFKIRDKIIEIMEQKHIIYEIYKYDSKNSFNKPLAMNKNTVLPKTCISNGCTAIWNGKIARCPNLLYVSRLNQKFNTSFPEEGIEDIATCKEGKELLEFLYERVPLCDFCISKLEEWEICKKEVKLEDFAYIE